MVEVSDSFKKLAQENGRRVWCRIEVGGTVFLDDSIISMSFDDVVHPDWFAVGTTCANRLHFTARFSGEIPAGSEVRSYISFDGEEWCPLGVFYTSRRYVRGSTVSITAYDRMYSLDVEYSYDGVLPVTSDVLLRNVCQKNGIECSDAGFAYKIEAIPQGCTARDIIGYIAGLNRACAKFDREGRLTFKQHRRVDFYLMDQNCWEVQRNMSDSVITCLKADTGEGILQAGSGSEISTLEMYNPFMTQAYLDNMYSMFKPFSFYGAELEMQGMPFLEAGDRLFFLDGKMLYPLVISEIEYTYNGGLSAVLYSRNKVYEEDSGDLENLLKRLLHRMNAVCYKQVNPSQIALKPEPQIIADFEFEAGEECFAQLDLNFTLKNNDADFLELIVNVNGVDVPRRIIQSLASADYELLHVYHLAEKLPAGKNRIYVTARLKTGSAYIGEGNLLATVVGHGLYASAYSGKDKVSMYEKADRWSIGTPEITLRRISASINMEVT